MGRFFYAVVVLMLTSVTANAGIRYVEMAFDGFTCSLCSRSVENSIRQLSFVEDFQIDLNTQEARIYFRKGESVSIHKLVGKVYDAGFAVRYVKASFEFSRLGYDSTHIYKEGEFEFHFIGMNKEDREGVQEILFLNKKFTTKKDYVHWERWIKEDVKLFGKRGQVYFVKFSH